MGFRHITWCSIQSVCFLLFASIYDLSRSRPKASNDGDSEQYFLIGQFHRCFNGVRGCSDLRLTILILIWIKTTKISSWFSLNLYFQVTMSPVSHRKPGCTIEQGPESPTATTAPSPALGRPPTRATYQINADGYWRTIKSVRIIIRWPQHRRRFANIFVSTAVYLGVKENIWDAENDCLTAKTCR